MDKSYNHQLVEDRLYAEWEGRGYFKTQPDPSKEPYTVMMPPPNVTAQLHMGHALDNTLQDIMVRCRRMQGRAALWVPGTDHASIATEAKLVQSLAAEGLTKADLGREKYLERAWDWAMNYRSRIVGQLKKMGSSCDWDRERFTMDEGLNNAVLEFFVRLYDKGYIYRGEKLVNWCTHCKTTISDAEVEHTEREDALYNIKYPIKGTDKYIQFATTRPETILADTAVAVNPDDGRYAGFVGMTAVVPFMDREIPIIADGYVDMEFGIGVVKITPGHDPNDFLVGERHNLPRINILNDDGTMNDNAGAYAGMAAQDARKRILADLDALGLYMGSTKLTHSVGTHDRCKRIIEPMLKVQWFVRMDELAKPAIEAYKSGELRIVPERFGKI
ncbi:MAG: class I tRNA ligase family protein, partial [Clostridiales bacterium]|nr:class I tRNA ligase family protein [Clostridiales bacterium]